MKVPVYATAELSWPVRRGWRPRFVQREARRANDHHQSCFGIPKGDYMDQGSTSLEIGPLRICIVWENPPQVRG